MVASYNFIDPGTSAADDRGHGTAVASIIAANTNFNSVTTGMAGACPNCKLLNAKVLNSNNMGTTSGVAEAMYWAKDQGADVINMSLGYRSNVLSEAEQDALAYVQSGGNNVTVVAATGNRGENNLFYPAAHPHIIGVGGVYAEGDRGILSNHGNWVDLMAYGYSIRVAWYQTNTAYTFDSGTSFAAPFVSGAAGLLYDRGDLPASNQANYIRKTLIDSARLSSETALSNRVLDAGAAVTDTFTQETQTTRAVRFYVYQDNNNSGELDIGDVCIRETMDLQERTPGSTPYWTILAPVLYTNSSPMVITTGAQLDDCSFGSPSRNLAIGKAHFVYQSSTDGKEITYFTPDYDNSIQYIEIEYEKFGDCNGDGVVTSADITAVGTEIFDGDSSDWMSTQGGTFAGTRFCDANRSGTVEAADISCVGLKIFDPDETCS